MRIPLLILLICTPLAPAADWPGFLGPTRDGHSTETKLNWNWGKEGPPVAWTIDIGKGFAGPVVVGNAVYVFHRIDDEEILSAHSTETGKEIWKYKAPARGTDGPEATPLVVEGTVYTVGLGAMLTAVKAKNGEKIWSVDLRKLYAPPEGYFGFGAGLLHHNGKILVNVGAKGAGIVAFDAATGKELWKATDDPPSYSTPVLMDIGGVAHAVVFTRTGLAVVNADTGKVLVQKRHRARIDASVNAASPVIANDSIFLSSSYETGGIAWKINGGELEELWSDDKSLSCHFETPVRVGEYLYGIHGRVDGGAASLVCCEFKTGAVKWSEKRFGGAHLIHVDSGLLALTETGELVRFEASEKAYSEKARATVMKGLTRAAPALADGQL